MAGNIRIIEPKSNYQKVAKAIILNEDVDALTLGIYVKVICLGKKWDLNVRGLAAKLGLSPDKIRASFAILEKTGYLRRTRVQGAGGRFVGWDYEISSEPLTDIAKTPTSEKTEYRKAPTSEKWHSIDKDIIPEDRDIEQEYKDIDSQAHAVSFVPPTVAEVEEYAIQLHAANPSAFADFFVNFCDANGWRSRNGEGRPITNWRRYIVTSWGRRLSDPFTDYKAASSSPSNSASPYHLTIS